MYSWDVYTSAPTLKDELTGALSWNYLADNVSMDWECGVSQGCSQWPATGGGLQAGPAPSVCMMTPSPACPAPTGPLIALPRLHFFT